jgi:hypothetical protein
MRGLDRYTRLSASVSYASNGAVKLVDIIPIRTVPGLLKYMIFGCCSPLEWCASVQQSKYDDESSSIE